MKIILHSWYIEIWSTRLFNYYLRGYASLYMLLNMKWIYSKQARLSFKSIIMINELELEEETKELYGTPCWPLLIMNTKCIQQNLIVKDDIPYLLNHEKIHLRQQLELPLGLFFILKCIERWYLSKKMPNATNTEIYLNCATEQEAYINMYNLNYLKERKFWSVFNYIKNKKKIIPGEKLISNK